MASGQKPLYEQKNCYSDRGMHQKNSISSQIQQNLNGGFGLSNANRKLVINKRVSLIQQKQNQHISRTLASINQVSSQINRDNMLVKSNGTIVQNNSEHTPMQMARKLMKSKSPSRDEGALPIIYHRKNNSGLYNVKGSHENSARYIYSNTQESDKKPQVQNQVNFNKTQQVSEAFSHNFEKQIDKRVTQTSPIVQDLLHKLFPKQGKVFDHTKVLIQLKSSAQNQVQEELLLDRQWLKEQVPHIRDVLAGVADSEKVEITINCNVNAFIWIIRFLKSEDMSMFENLDDENCLHLLVSSNFLGLTELYQKVWRLYFLDQFVNVINSCKMNLKNLNKVIVKDIALKISEQQLEALSQRKDKFISTVYKAKSELLMEQNSLYYCKNCQKLMTQQQSEKVNCHENLDLHSYIEANGQLIMRHDIDQPIEHSKFITFYRSTYRICWKEFYLKVKACVESPQFCTDCSRYVYLNELGNQDLRILRCTIHSPNSTLINNEGQQVKAKADGIIRSSRIDKIQITSLVPIRRYNTIGPRSGLKHAIPNKEEVTKP